MHIYIHIRKQQTNQQRTKPCERAQQQRVAQSVIESIIAENPRECFRGPCIGIELHTKLRGFDALHAFDDSPILLIGHGGGGDCFRIVEREPRGTVCGVYHLKIQCIL